MIELKDTIYPWISYRNRIFDWIDNFLLGSFPSFLFGSVLLVPYFLLILPFLLIMNRFDYLIGKWIDVCDTLIEHDFKNQIIVGVQLIFVLIVCVILTMGPLSITYLAPRLIIDIRRTRREKEERKLERERRIMVRETRMFLDDIEIDATFRDGLVCSKIKKHRL